MGGCGEGGCGCSAGEGGCVGAVLEIRRGRMCGCSAGDKEREDVWVQCWR